jgi:hypothetical protein
LEDIHEFEKPFRPLSVQVQDNECGKLVSDHKGCASRHFGPDDLRFYDADVDSVKSSFSPSEIVIKYENIPKRKSKKSMKSLPPHVSICSS